MRKVAVVFIVMSSFGIGMQYALDQRWWGVLACVLAVVRWLSSSQYKIDQRATVSFLFLSGLGLVGILLGYTPLWSLTNFVILLIAWDLDRFAYLLRQYLEEQNQEKKYSTFIFSHFKRLGVVAGLGWCFGVIALNVQISIGFAGALGLGLLLFLGLREIVRLNPKIQQDD